MALAAALLQVALQAASVFLHAEDLRAEVARAGALHDHGLEAGRGPAVSLAVAHPCFGCLLQRNPALAAAGATALVHDAQSQAAHAAQARSPGSSSRHTARSRAPPRP